MGTHLIPRDTKGEVRILYIFSYKALAYTAVATTIGFILYKILDMIKLGKLGIVILIICALLGFGIATFKIPNTKNWEVTRKAGGEKIDAMILRWIKFKRKKNKIYVNTKEEEE